jgi:chemotaxis protein MotB
LTDEKPHELLIIKRNRGGEAGHHGGAWKIAFADFMTAMMALFLVLWLLSATNEKTKVSIARFFNPVKLVDMSTMKKGVSDPNENISSNPDPKVGSPTPAQDISAPATAADHQPTHSEAALFRDPYAVLAEIVASGEAREASLDNTPMADKSEKSIDLAEPFKDPFKIMIPDVLPNQADVQKKAEAAPAKPGEPAVKPALPIPAPLAAAPPASFPHAPPVPPVSGKAAPAPASQPQQQAVKAQSVNQAVRDDGARALADRPQKTDASIDAETIKLRGEILEAIAKTVGKTGADKTLPDIEIKASDEGILISLTDQYNYTMFAIGSAEPQARTIQVMDKIAAILKQYPGGIVIRGHTDGHPYKSGTYDNWRLSSARAQMAEYMLIRGGLDEKRVEKIEGHADHKLKNAQSPFADENRRIEILLRKDRT